MNIEIKISKQPIPYIKAIKYLEKRVNKIKMGIGKDFIWILEHPTTYTAGIRSNKNEIQHHLDHLQCNLVYNKE